MTAFEIGVFVILFIIQFSLLMIARRIRAILDIVNDTRRYVKYPPKRKPL